MAQGTHFPNGIDVGGLAIGGVDVTLTAAQLNAAVQGTAGGFRMARGQATTASASDTVITGLTTVVSAVGNLEDVPVATCDRAQANIGDQAGTPAAGSILIKTFMPTAAGNTAPIAATTFVKKVNWLAVGT